MIEKQEMVKVLDFLANRLSNMKNDSENNALRTLPDDFWMNSIGGRTANGGYWVNTIFYTENIADANAFKSVLLKWQERGAQKHDNGPNLIQIGKKKTN